MMRMKFTYLTILCFAVISLSSCKEECAETAWYQDLDNDGFGDANSSQMACDQPTGYVTNSDDPNDGNVNITPSNVWTGATTTFTKADGADWTQAANQDQITSNVHLTRASNKGIFNIVTEDVYEDFVSPVDTEWAYGTISTVGPSDFDTWENLNGSVPPDMVDQDLVLHLITDDIYINFKFTFWAIGRNGGQGGMTYERSTEN